MWEKLGEVRRPRSGDINIADSLLSHVAVRLAIVCQHESQQTQFSIIKNLLLCSTILFCH